VARVGLSFGIAAVLAGATLARNRVYASDETVWRDVVSSRPGNVRARVNLASALYDRGRYDEAMELARSALNLLRGMEKVGHAELLGMEGTPTGGEMFRKAFDYSGAHNTVGLVLQAQGKTEEARGHFTEALRLAPGNVSARSNLGSALYVLGRFEEAMAHWRQALEATPDDAAVHRCVGDACWRTGRGDLAIWHYEAALRVMPDDTLAGTRLAWALATSPRAEWRDGARAVVLAKNAARACDHRSAHVADVLGAAYAECGKFDEAEKAAGLAFALGPGAADAAAIAERLALYRKGMPYRDTTGGGAAERRSRSANGREDVGQSGGQ
jgi:predicted Zn-dependent protease